MQQLDMVLFRFRYVLGVFVVLGCLIALSAVVTATGANTVLDTRSGKTLAIASPAPYDTANVVTTGAYNLADASKRATVSAGSALYSASRTINQAATVTGKAFGHGTAVAAKATATGVTSVGRFIVVSNVAVAKGIGSVAVATVRAPVVAFDTINQGQTVSAIIRPGDDIPTPTIDAETSSAVLKQLNEQKQQEIAKLLAGQLAANRGLVGSIVAGDPQHGGYPARWDHAPQDSLLDSWGMYNRECVSYAAWKVYQTYGHMPYWGGIGNANQWLRNARNQGIPTRAAPKVHSVAISLRGYYGHAMWVEKVAGDMIYVSQYNWDMRGHYSEMWVKANQFTYIHFQ